MTEVNKQKILLIEDDIQFHRFVKQALDAENYTVWSAFNGLEASHLLISNLPDLIITDLLMPIMDGVRLISEIKVTHPNIPIVAMSGGQSAFSPAFLESALAVGATHTLDKPFDCEQLLELVRNCFD